MFIVLGSDASDAILRQILIQVIMVVTMCQSLVHTIIAINRLTAFANPMRHSKIWNIRTVTASILGMITLAVLLDGGSFLYFGISLAPDAHGGSSGGPHLPWHVHGVGNLFVQISLRVSERG